MPLEGSLSFPDIAHLFQVIAATLKSGLLEISWEDRWARLVFERGNLVRAELNRRQRGIGSLLVTENLLARSDLDRALDLQREEGGHRRLGALLCEQFGVRPKDLERLLRRQFEEVVFDVFSWPGGQFVFAFQEPGGAAERFGVDAADFILSVGVQAGLLEGEGANPERPHLLFLERDPNLGARCQRYWRRKGHPVTCFTRVGEAVACLGSWNHRDRPPVILANLVPAGSRRGLAGLEVLEAARGLQPQAPALVLEERPDPKARMAARSAGAQGFVRKPKAEDLDGPEGEAYFHVFMIAVGRALQRLLSGSAEGRAWGA